jgi:hypothetical protein
MTSSSVSLLRRYLTSAVLVVPPVLYYRDNFYSLYVVRGTSMEPSLNHGDVLLVRKSDVYPERMWRRWKSGSSPPPSVVGASEEEDEDRYDDVIRVMALDSSSGRPIGDGVYG